jgi:hypothetical protein
MYAKTRNNRKNKKTTIRVIAGIGINEHTLWAGLETRMK